MKNKSILKSKQEASVINKLPLFSYNLCIIIKSGSSGKFVGEKFINFFEEIQVNEATCLRVNPLPAQVFFKQTISPNKLEAAC